MKAIPEKQQQRVSLPREIYVWCALVLILWFICQSLMSYWEHLRQYQYPYTFPFFPVQHLFDIYCLMPRFQHVHSVDFFSPRYDYPYQYPAPAAVFYLWEAAFSQPVATFFVSAVTGVLALTIIMVRRLRSAHLEWSAAILFPIFIVLTSFTMWFEFIQANIEIFSFLLLAVGIFAYLSGRHYLAAAVFGLAGSMKIFPIALLGLFVPTQRWKELGCGLLVAGISTVAGLWILCPDLHYSALQVSKGLALQRDQITLFFDIKAVGFDHSIFALLKILAKHQFDPRLPVHYPAWAFRTYVICVVLSGVALWFARIRKLPTQNQIASLIICAILLPPTSYEYTLLHMYIPFALLVFYSIRRAGQGQSTKDLLPFFICFAVLFSPTSELIVRKINVGGTAKCLALVALLCKYVTSPLQDEHSIAVSNKTQVGHTDLAPTCV